MRNEILKWAEEQARTVNGITVDYDYGYIRAMLDIKEKINSIPIPNNLEGYLEGKVWDFVNSKGHHKLVYESDALVALQALESNKDKEIEQVQKSLDEHSEMLQNELQLNEKLVKEITNLTAEVGRLKGESQIQKLRGMLVEMMHKNPHIAPYDIVKMIDKISMPDPPKQ